MTMPKILSHDRLVVTVPIYNEERFIAETVQSLKVQDDEDFRVLVADNASTDRTEDSCREAISGDPRFHYVRHAENRGAAYNFNFALESTESPLFMWLGGHDRIAPSFLSSHICALDQCPECSLSYSFTQWIDEEGNLLNVTDPGELGSLPDAPLARYFHTVRKLAECTAINNVLRRRSIGPTRFSSIPGCDKVILSELVFSGKANLLPRPLYQRREISRRADYMERLSGEKGVSRDDRQLAALYLESHEQLRLSRAMKALTRPLLESLLERRLTGRFDLRDRAHIWLGRLIGI